MNMLTRDELIAEAMPGVLWVARSLASRGLPRGVSVEDLESIGNEALLEAYAVYEPGSGPWKAFSRHVAKQRMKSFLARARELARRSAPLEILTPDGDELPRADPRAVDPAELASAREVLAPVSRPTTRMSSLTKSLPSPAEVADRVTKLRAAMFGAISEQDVQAVMAGVVERAKDGSARDVKLLLDLLAPSRSGVTVQQQAVVIHQGDI